METGEACSAYGRNKKWCTHNYRDCIEVKEAIFPQFNKILFVYFLQLCNTIFTN